MFVDKSGADLKMGIQKVFWLPVGVTLIFYTLYNCGEQQVNILFTYTINGILILSVSQDSPVLTSLRILTFLTRAHLRPRYLRTYPYYPYIYLVPGTQKTLCKLCSVKDVMSDLILNLWKSSGINT